MAEDQSVVLVVEDEPAVAESFEMMLEGNYHVRTAGCGEECLAVVDDTVDVVLLDRMMPDISGDEVLEEIRSREVDCRVVMVTAVDPDFDIVDMGFDDYLIKPPTEAELTRTIETVLDRGEFGERVREYHSLLAKRSALQAEKSEAQLAASAEFAELEQQIAECRRNLESYNEQLIDDTAFFLALRDLGLPAGAREADE